MEFKIVAAQEQHLDYLMTWIDPIHYRIAKDFFGEDASLMRVLLASYTNIIEKNRRVPFSAKAYSVLDEDNNCQALITIAVDTQTVPVEESLNYLFAITQTKNMVKRLQGDNHGNYLGLLGSSLATILSNLPPHSKLSTLLHEKTLPIAEKILTTKPEGATLLSSEPITYGSSQYYWYHIVSSG
jgi:hypothetical protein